jgi:predicted nucleotidyltransferase component of viral defense system
MPGIDFVQFARNIATVNDSDNLLPVIEKELLHYEILRAMQAARLFADIVFQGGTCLRLCYGAQRASEDLDFAGGTGFEASHLSGIKDCIEQALPKRYLVQVQVSDATGINALVKKWRIKIDTSPLRPDLPSQRITLEVAAVPSYTKEPRMLQLNYEGLPSSYEDIVVPCESLEEILADKLESFVCSPRIRYRDVWDLQWLARRPGIKMDVAHSLRTKKELDYRESSVFTYGLSRVSEELSQIIEGHEFLTEMKRFLPQNIITHTVESSDWRVAARNTIVDLYSRYLL